jgi:hypothetical protein
LDVLRNVEKHKERLEDPSIGPTSFKVVQILLPKENRVLKVHGFDKRHCGRCLEKSRQFLITEC